jgi:hypothetical protein
MIRATFDHKKYLTYLKAVNKEAHAESVRNLLNYQAKGSEKLIKKTVKKKFVVRTNFTINSIKNDRKPLGNNTKRMFSRVVTTSPYLENQDDGGIEKKKSIPTLKTRSDNFKKVVKKQYRQNQLGNFQYEKSKPKTFFLGKPKGNINRPYGIYMRYAKNKKLTKIRNVSQDDVKIKQTKFFSSSVNKYAELKTINKFFSLDAQKRLKEISDKFY